MSAGIMPDIYRHTARKSTITKALKSSLVNKTNNNNSTALFHQDKLYESIECKIKLEEDILPQTEEKFFILPNNELEEMIVDTKETNEEIITNICRQIINEIVQSFSNQIRRSSTNDTQADSIESTNVNTNSTDMDTPRSISDDDILDVNNHSCACQCHQSDQLLTNDYLLFEQALKQTRFEQEKLVNKNRLMQTLKRQHDELMQIYQQNKHSKQHQTKVDREQQTIQSDRYDSPVQTDTTPLLAQKKISTCQQPKPNTTKSSTSSAFQPFIPRFASNSPSPLLLLPPPPPPPPAAAIVTNTNNSHEIVDLTEEDDEDDNTRTSQISTPTRQNASSVVLAPPPQAPISLPSPTLPTATRVRQINRSIRPNNSAPSTQLISLRPLPENIPCDHSIARPQLSITQENATVRLTWNLLLTPMESIKNYEIYAYKQSAAATSSDWKKIGTVKSMRLPMAVTLKEFQSNSHYAFAVRAISILNRIGPFCEPRTIFTGLNSVQPLHTSQLLNVATK